MKYMFICAMLFVTFCVPPVSHADVLGGLTAEDRNNVNRLDRLFWATSLTADDQSFISDCLQGISAGVATPVHAFTPGQRVAYYAALKVAAVHSRTNMILGLKTWDEDIASTQTLTHVVVAAFETPTPFQYLLARAGPPPHPLSTHPQEHPITVVVVAAEARARRNNSTLDLDFSGLQLSPYHSLLLSTSSQDTQSAIQTLLGMLAGLPVYDLKNDPDAHAVQLVLRTYLADCIEPILERLEETAPSIAVTSAEVEVLVGVLRFIRDEMSPSQRDRATAAIHAFPSPSSNLQAIRSRLPDLLE